ncbi:MAG: hypothetical protein ACRDLT_06015, partial [Solirubrobacteraceae bacterium]
PGGAGDLSATATISVRGPLTVSAGTPAIVTAGSSASATVVVTSHTNRAVVVQLTPSLPSGVTVSPTSPSVRVPARRRVRLTFTVAVAAGQAPARDQMSLAPSFTYRGKSYPLAAAALTVAIPYASLAAAYNGSAISDDGDIGAADFDGDGNSYSEQALTAAGLAPGAGVVVAGSTLQWPDVAAGAPDNVLADGQTIAIPGASPLDTQLALLGASSGRQETGTGLVEYTDGTLQRFRLTFDNWFKKPVSAADDTIASTPYMNDSTGSGNHGVVGKRYHRARVFGVVILLRPGKTVANVMLPQVATLPGVYPMHIFALGLGGGPAPYTERGARAGVQRDHRHG